MSTTLINQFITLEGERAKLMNQLVQLSDEQANKSPVGKWSILEILMHIITSEKMSLGYMKKKSLAIDVLDDSGIIESLKVVLLKISQRIPFKYKAPKIVVDKTPKKQSLDEVSNEWNSLRGDMKTFVESIDERYVRKKIYRHPVAGRLDASQALVFLSEHFHHHLPQINRLLK